MKRMIMAAAVMAVAVSVKAEEIKELRAYYFGNSLTGSTLPKLHPELGASAGKVWTNDIMALAGGQLWQYREAFRKGGKLKPTRDNQGFTIDADIAKVGSWAADQFLRGQWDAIVMQPFGGRRITNEVVTAMWGQELGQPVDVSDFASARDLTKLFLSKNPTGTVYIYQDWVGMPLYNAVTDVGGVGKSKKELNHAQMQNLRRSFDFGAAWLANYAPVPGGEAWADPGVGTQDYEWQLFELLRREFPELWAQGRLRMIPVGDIYFVLDRKMRAGQVPGVWGTGEFYTDGLHHRAGLPAYTGAAAFYTLLFREHPGKLDYRLYQDPAKLGDDPHNDRGEPLVMSPEVAKIINETIWEVAQAHPFTRLSAQGSPAALRKFVDAIPYTKPVGVLSFGNKTLWSAMPAWQPALDRTAGQFSSGQFFLTPSLREVKTRIVEKKYPSTLYQRQLDDLNVQVLFLQPTGKDEDEATAAAWLVERFLAPRPAGRVLTWGSEGFVAGLRQALPQLGDRLRAVPVEAVLAKLDAKGRGFYKAGGLLRTGLPRYAVAATLHAALFGTSPAKLDAELFNNPAAYPPDPGAMKPGVTASRGNVPLKPDDYDNGPHVPVTPADKKLVDTVIAETLKP